jgi:hypothetical protein
MAARFNRSPPAQQVVEFELDIRWHQRAGARPTVGNIPNRQRERPIAHPYLADTHRNTLRHISEHATSHNLEWPDALSFI